MRIRLLVMGLTVFGATVCAEDAATSAETGAKSISADSLLNALGGAVAAESIPGAESAASPPKSGKVRGIPAALLTGSPALTAQLADPAMPTDLNAKPAPQAAPVIAVPFDLLASALADGDNKLAPEPPLKINQAGAEDLQKKLRIDPRRARFVIEYRKIFGPFRSPEDLAQVAGINDEMVLAWEQKNLIDFAPPEKTR